jgi:UDP-N-acetylglucosamine acyltransferase
MSGATPRAEDGSTDNPTAGTVSTSIAPSAFVGPGVELGVGVVVGPFAVLLGPARIGDRVRLGPGAHVGGAPEIASQRQNAAWTGDLDHHEVVIGPDTVLRDHVVIHHGSVRPTTIGRRCWIFSHAYLAHDVVVGDDVTLSAGVALGGHVTVRRGANLGLNVSVHQRRCIGAFAMVGMGTPVTRDVPPFTTAYGIPPRVHGVNRFGMSRAGIAEEDVAAIEGLLARGGLEAAAGRRSPDVEAELDWWRTLADRRPMQVASPQDEDPAAGAAVNPS